jgi:hypothetical protein
MLQSPGVDVQIIPEDFYASAGAGTIPLIVVATASNKPLPGGTGVAPFTVPSQAGKLFLATSQRELAQNFGVPFFYSEQGTQLHGYELNEYGLHAAYSFLGIRNRAYVLRADIDLAQLASSDSAPRGVPLSGTYWLDLSETRFGIFQSNGNALPGAAWIPQPVLVATEADVNNDFTPRTAFGTDGDFVVVPLTSENYVYERINGAWYRIGSSAWASARPTLVRGVANPAAVTAGDEIVINGSTVTFTGTNLATVINDINGAAITNIQAELSGSALQIRNTAGGNIVLANETGTPLVTLGITPGTYKGPSVVYNNTASYPAGSASGDVWIKGNPANRGAQWKVRLYNGSTGLWTDLSAPFYPFNSALIDGNNSKDSAALSALGIPVAGSVYVGYDGSTGVMELRRWTGSRWESLVYEADSLEPTTDPVAGTYWYSADFRADIMVNDGDTWIGYRRMYPNTDPAGVLLSGTAPITQSDGTPLVENDLWIDTSDLENYPMLHRYDATTSRWRLVDKTDQTTPFGVVFADARANSGTAFTGIPNSGAYVFNSTNSADMALSDFVEPDAPDPRTFPAGMLLFNTRYSTYNVKEWSPLYFLAGGYDPNTDYTTGTYTVGASSYVFPALASPARWVTASGNRPDGAMFAGRKAQRAMVVRALAAAVAGNADLRSDIVYFNIAACPGYPELLDELVALNVEQKEVSFIIADTPARLPPSGTNVQAWATNSAGAASTGEDGLTTSTYYGGLYYPWGLGTNSDGAEIMIPPSTMALRVFAYNDSVGYPWLAPAGFSRGLVSNASTVGYLTSEGQFQPVLLNDGQTDVMYLNKINPIRFIPNRGLVVYGQKTLSPTETSLDRVNVARLANYLKYNLDIVLKPFLFEPNDQQTRDSARLTVERLLNGLVGLRAITDYFVLCDTSNNTAERIDRNELWIDVLIKPVKAIEFIYVPVRLRSSGDDLLVGQTVNANI